MLGGRRSLVNARRPCEWPAVVAHLSDKPGVLELDAEDDVTRSAAVIQAASYQLVPLSTGCCWFRWPGMPGPRRWGRSGRIRLAGRSTLAGWSTGG